MRGMRFSGSSGERGKEGFSYLVSITAADFTKYLTVFYFIRNMESFREESLEVDIDASDAWVPSVIGIYAAADWYEREMKEMFGIEVRNRRAARLLLENWDGKQAPLRKSFKVGTPYGTDFADRKE